MDLFKNQKPKAVRAYRVENLNPSKGVFMSYRVSRDQREHVVCLCLTNKTVKTTFHSEFSALEQLRKYRALYKELGEK